MEEDRTFGTDQLNNDPHSEEAAFRVEDIIAEFGVREEAAEVPAVPVSDAGTAPEAEDCSAPEAEDYPAPELLKPPQPRSVGVLRQFLLGRARLREALDAAPGRSDEEARDFYRRRQEGRRLSRFLSWLTTLIAVLAALLPLQPWLDLSGYLTSGLCGVLCVGALLSQLLLALPVLTAGVQRLLALRFSKESYLALTTLITLLYGLQSLLTGSDGAALCAVASLLLTVAQHGDDCLTSAKAACLSHVLSMEAPTALIRGDAQWDGRDCLSRRPLAPTAFQDTLEERPAPDKQLGVYTLLVVSLTFAAALVAAVRGGRNFLWAWSILLLGSCPLGAFRAYGCAFRKLNKKLASSGAVVLGWGGASKLGGKIGVIVRDDDLFSKNAVSLNGVKVFGAHAPERLLGYAAAMLERAGAGASAAFSESLELQNGRHFQTDHFRAYDMGGLGAEIRGDVVLLGSRAFLKTMGVEIPPEARVAQALYISVNGEAAGLFALRYSASDSVRSGLLSLFGCRGLRSILATRDALLTPDTVGKIYRLPPDRLEYPVLRDRLALSDPAPREGSLRCAMLARDTFFGYASAVAGGRRLSRNVHQAFSAAFAGSVFGMLMMILLALLGAEASASAANLLLYHLLWLIPSLWLTSLSGS